MFNTRFYKIYSSDNYVSIFSQYLSIDASQRLEICVGNFHSTLVVIYSLYLFECVCRFICTFRCINGHVCLIAICLKTSSNFYKVYISRVHYLNMHPSTDTHTHTHTVCVSVHMCKRDINDYRSSMNLRQSMTNWLKRFRVMQFRYLGFSSTTHAHEEDRALNEIGQTI